LTGADIAASDNATGNVVLGGDWNLEYSTGTITSSLAFQLGVLESYNSVLAAFTAGDIVVLQVGTGSGSLSGVATAVSLNEYNSAGTLVQSIALPTADNANNQTLTQSGNAASEGALTLSADGRYLTLVGYDAAPGTAAVASTDSATVNRIVARVDGAGTVDTSTRIDSAYSTNNIRSAVTNDGSGFWVAGASGTIGGLNYVSLGSTGTSTQLNPLNSRVVNIFNGQLYDSSATTGNIGINAVGSALPTTGTPAISLLPGVNNTSAYAYVLLDRTATVAGLDTLYVADQTGLFKYSFDGSTWTARGSILGTLTGGLTGLVKGNNAELYATSGTAAGNNLLKLTDTTAYNASFSSLFYSNFKTAAANTIFKGVAFAPVLALPTVNLSVSSNTGSEASSSSITVTATASSAVVGNQTMNLAVAGTSITTDDYILSTSTPNTITILNGQTTGTATFTVVDDSLIEGTENATLTISSPSSGMTLGTTTQTIAIADNDFPKVNLSVGSTAGSEAGTTAITVTATASSAVVGDQTVNLAVTGTNITSGDYTLNGNAVNNVSVTIPTGQTTGTATFTVVDDTLIEGPETATLTISSPSAGITLGNSTSWNISIADNDFPAVNLSVSSNAGSEAGTTAITVTATASSAVIGNQRVDLAVGGTGITTGDFTLSSYTLTIPNGQTTGSSTFTVVDDTLIEGTETATLTISNPSTGIILGSTTTKSISIADNDFPKVNLSVGSTTGLEAGSTAITVTATASSAVVGDQTVNLAVGGTNITTGDYTLSGNTITILSGQTTGTATFTVVDDTLIEGTETATLTISSPSAGITLGNIITKSISITDNDFPTVNLSVNSNSSSETSPAAITVTATASSAVVGNQTVNLAVGGTNITTGDYTLSGNTITILNGQTTGTATFTVVDDTLVEGPETATLTISNSSTGITLGSTTQDISIADNDVLPTVTLSTQTPNITEGSNIPGVFHFARTGNTTNPLTVNYTVGTNTTSSDYNETLGVTVTIAAGQSVADITVTLVDDSIVEGIEYIELYLPTDPNYTVVAGTNSNDAVITIADNDVLPTVTIAAQDANAAEAGNDPGVFRITRTGATTSALTVNYQVSGNALTTDYTETLGGTVTIDIGQAFADITVTPVDDPLVEGSEYIDLVLPSNANYTVGTPGNNSSYAEVTIADNDIPTVSIAAQDANAAEAGNDPGVFRILRTGDTTSTLQVYFNVNGTVNGNDYTPGIYVPSVVIAAGESFADITINPVDDLLVEGPETVDLTLTSNAKYILGTSINAVVTIADNDVLPTVSILTQNNTAEGSNTPGVFRITRIGGDTASALTVNYGVTGTATGADYTEALGGTATIAPGQVFAEITITPVDDLLVEGSETVNLTLTANATVYTLGTTAATVSIADNDVSTPATRNDFNNDKKSDILWRNNDGRVSLWQMDGNTILPASGLIGPANTDWNIAGTGDFNGDGKSDILWRNNDGLVSLWQMDGNTILPASGLIGPANTDWNIAGTGDFNGDGKSDILWRNNDGRVSLWQMDGNTILPASGLIGPANTDWNIAGTGDFNGDGKSDVLWRSDDLGAVATWQMDGNTILPASGLVGSATIDWKIAAPIL
jgi:Domain of unknown function (DUF4347)/FG-GAP-like repeat/Calx-beta domain